MSTIFFQIQNLKKSLEIIPVNSTDCSVEGAECDFVKLLSETIRKLVSFDVHAYLTTCIQSFITIITAKQRSHQIYYQQSKSEDFTRWS